MPILFAASPLAGDPVGAGDDAVHLAATHQMRGSRVRDHRVRNAERLELPGGQPRALQERPRLVDPDVLDQTLLPRRAQRADGGAVAAGREPARVAVRQRTRSRAEQRRRVRRHPAAARDLFLVQCACPLGGGISAHLLERPDEVHGRRPRLGEHAVGRIEILPALHGQRVAVRGGDADRRRAAHRERPDRVGDLSGRLAPELDFLVRKPTLIQQDHGAGFQTNDAVGA